MRHILLMMALLPAIIAHGQEPMKINVQNSAYNRWLNKKVYERITLDDMEGDIKWVSFTGGAIALVDSRVESKTEASKKNYVEISCSDKKTHTGEKSLQIRFPSRIEVPGPKSGRGWGNAGIWYMVQNEDWSKYNRISVWVYPENPGAYQNWLEIRVFNDGKEKLPAMFGQEGESVFNLVNHEWNHIVWEIGNVARDKITKLEISTIISGHEPEACDSTIFYFDDLQLESVDPDYFEGWPVWKGRIAYSHPGYLPYMPKTAITNDPDAKDFKIIDDKTGKAVLSKSIQNVTGKLGNFQLMDFSEIMDDGSYHIEAGTIKKYAQ